MLIIKFVTAHLSFSREFYEDVSEYSQSNCQPYGHCMNDYWETREE